MSVYGFSLPTGLYVRILYQSVWSSVRIEIGQFFKMSAIRFGILPCESTLIATFDDEYCLYLHLVHLNRGASHGHNS